MLLLAPFGRSAAIKLGQEERRLIFAGSKLITLFVYILEPLQQKSNRIVKY